MPAPESDARPSHWRHVPLHFGQGLLMGSADVVPGVSGGTMALIVGIYERLIDSIRFALSAPVLLVTGRGREALAEFRKVEWGLVLPLAAGLLTAIVLASQVIPYFLETYPEESRGLFFGLIAASIAIPWRELRDPGLREGLIAAAAAAVAFLLVGLPGLEPAADPGLLRVFASASVAICAMILPGVSGAFLLLVLGLYEATLASIHARDVLYVATFGLGALVGLGLFSRLLTWLLDRHKNATMAALIGLMAGSLRALWPWQTEARELLLPSDNAVAVAGLMALGFAVVLALAWVGARTAAAREG